MSYDDKPQTLELVDHTGRIPGDPAVTVACTSTGVVLANTYV